MRTWYVKVVGDRRAERLEHQPVRPVGARHGFHRQLKEIVLSASAPADQGRRDGRRRNSQRRVCVEQAAHELLSEVGGHGTCCGACFEYRCESATQTDLRAKLCDDFEKTLRTFFFSSSRAKEKNFLSLFSLPLLFLSLSLFPSSTTLLPGSTGLIVPSSSSWTSSLRQQSLLKTPSPAARSATLGARSAVRKSACTTGNGFPTTVMFVLASATCAPAFPKTSMPRAVIACLQKR